jgi:hypothetical protein
MTLPPLVPISTLWRMAPQIGGMGHGPDARLPPQLDHCLRIAFERWGVALSFPEGKTVITAGYWKLNKWLRAIDARLVEATALARGDNYHESFERWQVADKPLLVHRFPQGTTGLETFDVYLVANGTMDIDERIEQVAKAYDVPGMSATR